MDEAARKRVEDFDRDYALRHPQPHWWVSVHAINPQGLHWHTSSIVEGCPADEALNRVRVNFEAAGNTVVHLQAIETKHLRG